MITGHVTSLGTDRRFGMHAMQQHREQNNESSEVVDILLPVTFYFNPST